MSINAKNSNENLKMINEKTIVFKSTKLFNKKVNHDNKGYSLYPKLGLLSILQITLGCWMIAFICVGFQKEYVNLALYETPEWICTFRCVSIFLILWFAITSLFIANWGIKELNDKNYLTFVFSLLGFTLVFSIANLILSITRTSFIEIKEYVKSLFSSDSELKQCYSRRNWKYIMMVCCLIVMTPVLAFIFYRDGWSFKVYTNEGVEIKHYYNWWFNSMQYFTIQTNLLCYLTLLCFVVKPSWRLFKSRTVFISTATYLLIVGVTYDFVLFPSHIASGAVSHWTAYEWGTNVFEHLIDPLAYCGCSIALLAQNKKGMPRDYLTTVKFGLIIPTVYLTYALCNTFVSDQSVYGWFTNCNPSVYTSTKSHGEPYYCLFIIFYWLVFLGVITGIWAIDQRHLILESKVKFVDNIENMRKLNK